MRIMRRWVDRRRIRALRRDWVLLRTAVEPMLQAGDSWAEVAEEMPDAARRPGAENEAAAERRFIPDVEPEAPSEEMDARTTAPSRAPSMAPVSPRAERRFLALKTRLARRSALLQHVVGGRALEEEALAAGRDMADLMSRAGTLVAARRFASHESDDFLREWHVVYLFLAKLEGAMTGSAESGAVLLRPDVLGSNRARFAGVAPRRAGAVWGKAIGFAVEMAILVAFVWMAASMLGMKPGDLRSALRQLRGAHSEQAKVPGSNDGVIRVEGAAVVQAPTGETEVTAPAAPASSPGSDGRVAALPASPAISAPAISAPGAPASGIPAESAFHFRMPRVVQPVILRYGTLGAFVLFGAFVSGLLLVFGVRSR